MSVPLDLRYEESNTHQKVSVTRIFSENYEAPARYEILCNKGGARSSKSYSLAQLFIKELTSGSNKKLLVTRKTMPALRTTAMKVILALLQEYGYYDFCNHDKSNNTIEYGTNWLLFCSIDKPSKIRSTEFNHIWMEEANEFTYDDYITLRLRMSAISNKGPNRIYLSYNPSTFCWINEKVLNKPETLLIHSTYKDNPYLPKSYVRMLLAMKDSDPNYYKVYALGEDGDPEGIIFQPFKDYQKDPNYDEVIYGLDFGFNNPSALARVGFYDDEPYLKELLYQSKLITSELIEKMNYLIPDKTANIYADAAEPDRIEEIKQAGFNIYPAQKSVIDGINRVKSYHPIYCYYGSLNLKKERSMYMWKCDKDGNYIDAPVKFKDHLMDGIRYAIYTHTEGRGYSKSEAYTGHGSMYEQDF